MDDNMRRLKALHYRGKKLTEERKWREAIEVYDEWLSIADYEAMLGFGASILYFQGKSYLSVGELENARSAFLQARDINRTTEDHQHEVIALQSIAHSYKMEGDYEKAREYFEEAIACGKKNGCEGFASNAVVGLAKIYKITGELSKALELLQEDLNAALRANQHMLISRTLREIADVQLQMGKVEQARATYNNMLERAETRRDRKALAIAYGGLGNIEEQLGNLEEAREMYEKDLSLCKETRIDSALGRAYGNVGRVLSKLECFEEAEELLKKDLEIMRNQSDRAGQARALGQLGDLNERLGHFDSAVQYYKEDLEIVHELGDQSGEAHALHNLGSVYSRQGQSEEAAECFRKAIAIRERSQELLKAQESRNAMARLDHEKLKPPTAELKRPRDPNELLRDDVPDAKLLRWEDISGILDSNRCIGTGATGRVYEGTVTASNEWEKLGNVAVKVTVGGSIPERELRAFRREVRALCHISEHPNIMPLLGVVAEQAGIALVFPLGRNVRDRADALRSAGNMQAILSLLLDVASGLRHIHSRGLLHQDLKPSNILMLGSEDDTARCVITDFGTAKLYDLAHQISSLCTNGSQPEGTALYMAPEQAAFAGDSPHAVCRQSDMWSFGLLANELLSGERPYHEQRSDRVRDYITSRVVRRRGLPTASQSLPPPVQALINRCLVFDPNQRCSAHEACVWLRRIIESMHDDATVPDDAVPELQLTAGSGSILERELQTIARGAARESGPLSSEEVGKMARSTPGSSDGRLSSIVNAMQLLADVTTQLSFASNSSAAEQQGIAQLVRALAQRVGEMDEEMELMRRRLFGS